MPLLEIATMAAIRRVAFMKGPGNGLEVTSADALQARPNEVLIRNHAVALQPLDAKTLLAGYGPAAKLNYPAVLGTSGAGVIQEVGEGVDGLSVGDRVVFDTKAYVDIEENRRTGTWQEVVACDTKSVAKSGLTFEQIGDVAFEQAVLVDFPLQTAVAALHVFLGMGKPGSGNKEEKVLIWGAGGAVGSYAVQYAKQVGFTVVTTASPRDNERQQKLGATHVVDYRAADVVDKLRQLGPYKYLFTASGDAASQKALATLVQPTGGKFASVLPSTAELPSNVDIIYDAFSQAAQKEQYSDWRDWWYQEYLPEVLSKGLESVKFTKVEGGLSALQQASEDVFNGKVKGKVVINPQD
ncbi:alcohol dehydrogenase [Pyrenophora seminiperda CCB06]|uniref:Alcohol dehydrogenase n=1 Tax=Pyrenophora seminiperda CCB06 TaxID=1302712 RepID=A0A3M7M8T5_9PLEO|nr:alcohol dehydrogenase [Pyrenophora seminiperda CCB06]